MFCGTHRIWIFGSLVFGSSPAAATAFSVILAMSFGDPLPGSVKPLLQPALRDPAPDAPIKRSPMSAPHPSTPPALRSTALFVPVLSDSAAHSPAERGSIHPPTLSSTALHPPDSSASPSALQASTLHSSAISVTDTRNWGAVLDLPPLLLRSASVYGLVSSLVLVSLPSCGG